MVDRHEPFRGIDRAGRLDAIALLPGVNFTRLHGHDFPQDGRPLLVVIPAGGAPGAVVPDLELGSSAALGFEGEMFDRRDRTGYRDGARGQRGRTRGIAARGGGRPRVADELRAKADHPVRHPPMGGL